jgi:hypothetical protein
MRPVFGPIAAKAASRGANSPLKKSFGTEPARIAPARRREDPLRNDANASLRRRALRGAGAYPSLNPLIHVGARTTPRRRALRPANWLRS